MRVHQLCLQLLLAELIDRFILQIIKYVEFIFVEIVDD